MSGNPTMKIFLSYSRADSQFAHRLAEELRSDLLDDRAVWVDDWVDNQVDSVTPGTSWLSEITRELKERQFFVVVLSPDALRSEHVQWELEYALNQRRSERNKVIIGAQYQACDIPTPLAEHPVVSFLPTVDYSDALAQIHRLLINAIEDEEQASTEPMLDEEDQAYFLNKEGDARAPSSLADNGSFALLDLLPPSILLRLRWQPPSEGIQEDTRRVILEYLQRLRSRVEPVEPGDDDIELNVLSPSMDYSAVDEQAEPASGVVEEIDDIFDDEDAIETALDEPSDTRSTPNRRADAAISDGLALHAIVVSPVESSWPDDKRLIDHNLAVLRRAYEDLLAGFADDAFGRLASIPKEAFRESPSYLMRWHYYLGLTHVRFAERAQAAAGIEDHSDPHRSEGLAKARNAFGHALSLARHGQDVASQIIIRSALAGVNHNLMRYDLALSEYRSALTLLQQYSPGDRRACFQAESTLWNRIARQQFVLGDYGSALDSIREARSNRSKVDGLLISQWDRVSDMWLEALILRSTSQISGGDHSMLREAARLFRRAERWLEDDGEHLASLRRLYIQIAETYLDLAEVYRAEGNIPSFQNNMKLASRYAVLASDALRARDDAAGYELAQLTLLRYDHLDLRAYELSRLQVDDAGVENAVEPVEHALAPRIYDVERYAVEANDLVLLARAATLRADVLRSLSDYSAAMAVYYFAIATFERAGARGEAARAIYGVQRTLDVM